MARDRRRPSNTQAGAVLHRARRSRADWLRDDGRLRPRRTSRADRRQTRMAAAWRRDGVEARADRCGQGGRLRRLVTGSEARNAPMRNLNAKLGYRPEPSLSTVVLRG